MMYHIKWHNLYDNSFVWRVISDKKVFIIHLPLTTYHINELWYKLCHFMW